MTKEEILNDVLGIEIKDGPESNIMCEASEIYEVAERYAQSELSEANKEVQKLQAFKNYVHKRLDDAGIEKDPESAHKEAGCRIGGRLDIVLEANKDIERLKADTLKCEECENLLAESQQEIERLKEGLRKALKIITQSATESLRPEIQDYLSGGYAQYVQDAAFKDSLGIDSLITPK